MGTLASWVLWPVGFAVLGLCRCSWQGRTALPVWGFFNCLGSFLPNGVFAVKAGVNALSAVVVTQGNQYAEDLTPRLWREL